MGDVVFHVGLAVLAIAVPAWIVLSLAIVLGRLAHDRQARVDASIELAHHEARRLIHRAGGRPRTEWDAGGELPP